VRALRHAEYMVEWRARQAASPTNPRSFGEFSGVYFVQVGGFVKIGASDDVRARFRQLLCSSPYELVPLGFIYGDPDGTDELEADLHARFDELRHRGEWFRLEPSLREFINQQARPWPGAERDA
jgi:hypothetical protein